MDFNELFSGWNTMDSLAILFFMLIAFLFGFFVAYLLRGAKIRKLRDEINAQKIDLNAKDIEIAGLKEQLDLKEADLKRTTFELRELEAKILRIEGEKRELHNQFAPLAAELEKLQASNNSYIHTIEDLNNQIVGLKTQASQLQEEIGKEDETVDNLAQIQSIYNATRNRLEALEDKLDRLEGENRTLRQELDVIKDSGLIAAAPLSRGLGPETPLEIAALDAVPEEDNDEPEYIANAGKSVLTEKFLIDEPVEKDDLTLINGIGPFLEKQLNSIGVFTYEEISGWDSEKIEEVTHQIEYFPGRIERDDWVGQAARLLRIKEENPEALQPDPGHPTDVADLKIIEGIGPKIEQLLKEAGIDSWQELAEAPVERLREILHDAGAEYRIHDPGTWPNQARLAANGEWSLLKEYQEELIRGREVNE
jgi:predicted flap endonuclease-1-like 5' DNA nuclease